LLWEAAGTGAKRCDRLLRNVRLTTFSRGVRVANAGYLREIDKPGTDSGKQEPEAG
jgi:hypothetical protein